VENTPYVMDLKKRMETSARLKLFSNMVFVSLNFYSKKPITKVEDINGIKIRSFGPVLTKATKRLGASPMDRAAPEVAVALQTGAITGVTTSLNKGYIQSFGLVENSPYILLTPIVYNIGWWAINSDWWNGLPPDIQKSLEKTSDEIRSEVLKIETEDESSTLKWASQVGMKTTRLSAEEIAKCKGLMKPLYDEYISSVGRNLFDAINKAR
jgi:TRAP-type C4-dicarboxylate transport system substrate-binding protein